MYGYLPDANRECFPEKDPSQYNPSMHKSHGTKQHGTNSNNLLPTYVLTHSTRSSDGGKVREVHSRIFWPNLKNRYLV